jgi:hypothetical protein
LERGFDRAQAALPVGPIRRAGRLRIAHQRQLFVLKYLVEAHRAHSCIKRGRKYPSVASSSGPQKLAMGKL